MNALRVLEWIRSADQIWTLPRPLIESARARLPMVRIEAPATREEAEALLGEVDAVLGWIVRPENFANARRLKWVHVTAAGVNPLLFPEFVASDVLLSNGRGLHADAMAEHALGTILAFARKLHLARDRQAERVWAQAELWRGEPGIRSFAGSTLGIVGLGAIGGALARRARALGARVLAVRRHPAPDPAPADEQWGIERLGDLFERSDWVVLALPLTPGSERIVGAAELRRMRPDALLVNLGRGALVDEPALIAALERGAIGGAALDVTLEEPLPAASPLWAMPQVILTPHVSGLGPRLWERSIDQWVEHVEAFVAGRPLPNLVDKRAGY